MHTSVLMHLCSCAIVRQYITCLDGNGCGRCDVSSTISAADYWQVTRHLFSFFANDYECVDLHFELKVILSAMIGLICVCISISHLLIFRYSHYYTLATVVVIEIKFSTGLLQPAFL